MKIMRNNNYCFLGVEGVNYLSHSAQITGKIHSLVLRNTFTGAQSCITRQHPQYDMLSWFGAL